MAFRPTRKPSAQRPQDVSTVSARAVVGENPASSSAGQAASSRELTEGPGKRLLQELETVLRAEPGLDSDMRQMLQAQFAEALEIAERDPRATASVPARGEWLDAIDALKQSGLLADGEVNDLIRQIDGALAPLERRESRLAIEFSRRIQEQGQEQALEWFRQARAAEDDPSVEADAPRAGTVPAAGSEVIQSRSRRLRGPPVSR